MARSRLAAFALAVAPIALGAPHTPLGAPLEQPFSAGGLHYRVDGSGPPVVLIHAFHMDLREWDELVPRLTASRRVVRYDVRGHGSSKVAGALPSPVDDVVALLDELGIARATLVGSAMGSTIAMDLALSAPGRVERLILVAPGVPGIEQGASPEWLTPIMEAVRARESARAAELWWRSPLFDAVRSRPDAGRKYRQVVMENARIWTLTRAPGLDPPAGQRLREVGGPVVAIAGDRDQLGSLEVARAVAAGVGNGELVVVEGAGHMITLEQPGALARLILAASRSRDRRPADQGLSGLRRAES